MTDQTAKPPQPPPPAHPPTPPTPAAASTGHPHNPLHMDKGTRDKLRREHKQRAIKAMKEQHTVGGRVAAFLGSQTATFDTTIQNFRTAGLDPAICDALQEENDIYKSEQKEIVDGIADGTFHE